MSKPIAPLRSIQPQQGACAKPQAAYRRAAGHSFKGDARHAPIVRKAHILDFIELQMAIDGAGRVICARLRQELPGWFDPSPYLHTLAAQLRVRCIGPFQGSIDVYQVHVPNPADHMDD
jgi:hypothetical protein